MQLHSLNLYKELITFFEKRDTKTLEYITAKNIYTER